MKKIYKPGDEIKLSQFTKKQATIIKNQIELLDADQTGLDHFSIKLKRNRDVMFKIIQQSMPVLKDYVFHIEHKTGILKVVIKSRL